MAFCGVLDNDTNMKSFQVQSTWCLFTSIPAYGALLGLYVPISRLLYDRLSTYEKNIFDEEIDKQKPKC